MIKSSAATDKGRRRDNNEDSYLSLPERGLWLVADGMGGHDAGEVASAIVVEAIQRSAEAGSSLLDSIQRAHQSVLSAADEGVGAVGMGSTVVALQSSECDYQVAWVGDSRAYLWTPGRGGGSFEQLSTDHSYVQLLVESGAIAEHEAASHPEKNVITQCIGSEDIDSVRVDTVSRPWQKGQWILLCSDGLSDELSDEAIAQCLGQARSAENAIEQLMKQALDKGGRDNITVQIVESPLPQDSQLEQLRETVRQMLPAVLRRRSGNGGLYAAGLLCLILLLYWSLA